MICRIEALNYRSLRQVSQEVRSFEVLVGPNASGKSTFLDVPAFISDLVSDGLREATLFTEENGTGRARRLGELIFNQETDRFDLVQLGAINPAIGAGLRLKSHGKRRTLKCLDGSHRPPTYLSQRVLAVELAVPNSLIRLNSIGGMEHRYDVVRYALIVGRIKSGEAGVLSESLWLVDSKHRRAGASSDGASILVSPKGLVPGTLGTDSSDNLTSASYRVIHRGGERGDASYFAETEQWEITNRMGAQRSALSGLPEDPERFPVAIWVRDLLRDGVLKLALNSAAMRRPVSPSASRLRRRGRQPAAGHPGSAKERPDRVR